MSTSVDTPAVVRDIQLEVRIAATRERVWQALVEETAAWWHKDFYTGPGAKAFHLQPKLGGWMYEDWGEGNGLIWGTVIGVRTHEMLQVVGDSSPEWGGPSRGIMMWALSEAEDDAEQTIVRFRQALHGNVSDATQESLDGGWRLLFEGCLKPYAETGERPATADGDAPPCTS